MAKRNSKAHMAYVRSFRKNASKRRRVNPKRRRKANPWPVAGMVVANPRKRRNPRRRKNAVVHHRRRHHYSRNPKIMGFELPPINKVLFAGAGFLAAPMVEGLIFDYLPASVSSIATSSLGKYALRIGTILALSFGVRKFIGREEGNMVAIGGGVYVVSTAAMEFLPNVFTAHSAAPAQVSAYVPARQQLSAYVAANQPIMRQLGANSAFSDDAYSGAVGGTAVRFKR